MTIKELYKEACDLWDDDLGTELDKVVTFCNLIFQELFDYENTHRKVMDMAPWAEIPRVKSLEDEFPFVAMLWGPAVRLLASMLIEDEDINKSVLWRNRAIEQLESYQKYFFVDFEGAGVGYDC